MKRARNLERKKNRDVKFIENSDMKKLDKLMGSLDTEKGSVVKSRQKMTGILFLRDWDFKSTWAELGHTGIFASSSLQAT